MKNNLVISKISSRRTFAIISHPDAGKTTVTEKILLFGKVIQTAGSIKARRSKQYAKSDWMEIEKRRGISITTSVMQFPYRKVLVNLLDTPGHKDFSEDTYRTLTAVDCCLMVIDASKGVEDQTCKLMEVTRLRDIPIITFMNKMDCDTRSPIELLDEIEKKLHINCAPVTWPVGCGKIFKGLYHLEKKETYLYKIGKGHIIQKVQSVKGLNNPDIEQAIGRGLAMQLREELELIEGAFHAFDQKSFLSGSLTPVFFGTALGNFGIDHVLDCLMLWAPSPMSRHANVRVVHAKEENFTGFVFKIQANMDPKHRDRVAFLRIVSGRYKRSMKLYQVRTGKNIIITNAVIFMASNRSHIEEAYAGDIIGLHNHGSIQIGDTFTQGENLKFSGIPNFAPELFYRIRLLDPLKQKQLLKGLVQLSEEGTVQIFRPLANNDLIIGAVGVLQFDVVITRLKDEYNVEARYEPVNIVTVRWVACGDPRKLEEFKRKNILNLALDIAHHLSYVAPSIVNLNLLQERYPDIQFHKTREH